MAYDLYRQLALTGSQHITRVTETQEASVNDRYRLEARGRCGPLLSDTCPPIRHKNIVLLLLDQLSQASQEPAV